MPVNRHLMSRPLLAVLAAFAVLSSGCGFLHEKSDYYNKTPENRPLEVPPDLDTPVTGSELVVPAAGTGASAVRTSASSSAAGTAPPTSTAPMTTSDLSGGDLKVADTAAHTWQRVGLALERAQIGEISARDESAHTYTLDFNGSVEVADEHHWYSRVLHPFSGGGTTTKSTVGRLTVRVAEDGAGSKVSVEGDSTDKAATDSARRVAQALRDRLT
jgi:uncharacterized lipoprotein